MAARTVASRANAALERFFRALVIAAQDGSLGCAKGAAYSALLSIFPLISTVTAILTEVRAEAVASELAKVLFEVAPPGVAPVLEQSFVSRGQRPLLLLITASLLSIIAASGVILSLVDGFQISYRTPNRRGFWRNRWVAMLLVVGAAVPALAASAFLLYAGRVLAYLPAVVAVGAGTLLLYRFGPSLPAGLPRTAVWPGAVVATLLWSLTTSLFAWYVRHLANYNVIYGSIAAVIALLVWMYLLSASAIVGCAYNALRAREKLSA